MKDNKILLEVLKNEEIGIKIIDINDISIIYEHDNIVEILSESGEREILTETHLTTISEQLLKLGYDNIIFKITNNLKRIIIL